MIAAGPLVNLVVAFLILFALFWSEGRTVPGIVVAETEPGSPAAQLLKEGDRLTAPRCFGTARP